MVRRHRFFSLLLVLIVSVCGCRSTGEKKPTQATTTRSTRGPAGEIELQGAWEPDVRQQLVQLIARHGKGAAEYDPTHPPSAVFDFDNTCIRGDIGRAFFDWMAQNQKFKFTQAVWQALPADKRDGIRASWEALQKLPAEARPASTELQEFRKRMHQAYWSLCHEAEADKCYPWQVRFYAGYTPDEVRAMAEQVTDYELGRELGSQTIRAGDDDPAPAITSTGLRIHREIRQLMEVMHQRGFQVWVLTAGPQWVVQGAAKHFPVQRDRMIGMRTVLIDGKLTTEMEPPTTFRQGKVEAIEKFIGSRPVLVVGDSWTDAAMMEYAQHALLIDRGYADLRKKAFDAGWWIQPTFPVE